MPCSKTNLDKGRQLVGDVSGRRVRRPKPRPRVPLYAGFYSVVGDRLSDRAEPAPTGAPRRAEPGADGGAHGGSPGHPTSGRLGAAPRRVAYIPRLGDGRAYVPAFCPPGPSERSPRPTPARRRPSPRADAHASRRKPRNCAAAHAWAHGWAHGARRRAQRHDRTRPTPRPTANLRMSATPRDPRRGRACRGRKQPRLRRRRPDASPTAVAEAYAPAYACAAPSPGRRSLRRHGADAAAIVETYDGATSHRLNPRRVFRAHDDDHGAEDYGRRCPGQRPRRHDPCPTQAADAGTVPRRRFPTRPWRRASAGEEAQNVAHAAPARVDARGGAHPARSTTTASSPRPATGAP